MFHFKVIDIMIDTKELVRFRKIARAMLVMRDGFIKDGYKLADTVNDKDKIWIRLLKARDSEYDDVLVLYFDKNLTKLTITKNGKIRNQLY